MLLAIFLLVLHLARTQSPLPPPPSPPLNPQAVRHEMQEELRNYFLLAGAVQEYPLAHPLFFHRLAPVAKFEPTSQRYLHTTHLTVQPLSADQFAPIVTNIEVMDGRSPGWMTSWAADAFVNVALQDCAHVQTALACTHEISDKVHDGVHILPLIYWPHLSSAVNTSYAFFHELVAKLN